MAADPELVERARTLRRAGLSVEQIATRLELRSRTMVYRWVRDLPTPPWTARPTAKDAERATARELRLQGESLKVIARRVGVATSTVSVWVRDLEVPEHLRRQAAHARRINDKRWERAAARREAERVAVKSDAASAVGDLSERDLWLIGVTLYWAEGAKDKPWDRRERLTIINSDASVLRVFARWLDNAGVPSEDRTYRISIHETGDLDGAHLFWSRELGVPLGRFSRPTIKRHSPKTVRRNVNEDYHGCLAIGVKRSRVLYQRVDGAWRGIAAAVENVCDVATD